MVKVNIDRTTNADLKWRFLIAFIKNYSFKFFRNMFRSLRLQSYNQNALLLPSIARSISWYREVKSSSIRKLKITKILFTLRIVRRLKGTKLKTSRSAHMLKFASANGSAFWRFIPGSRLFLSSASSIPVCARNKSQSCEKKEAESSARIPDNIVDFKVPSRKAEKRKKQAPRVSFVRTMHKIYFPTFFALLPPPAAVRFESI